ncbi:uncharacterized protein DNG_01420 [Cephalotrichum gorgonifer]|uniref:Uncharacterized protein n=1 Tax=Cephalotrichum gorgonifer TaxID=2041049 RepID=A0AAE8SSA2_9PEZI|nr:uncharacterized protein DNG_01420 [Cephalotrichum gorgonifer]
MRIPLLALLGPLAAMAFYPTKFRANLSMTPGISHEQMTEDVLDFVMSALFPTVVSAFEGAHGVPFSRGMLDARTAIVQSNAETDWSYPFGVWHFDGESDAESSKLLEGLKAAAVKHVVEGNTFGARINLGNALHLVQDYFAYSDAAGAEHGGGELDRMRRQDLLSQSTLSRNEPQARWHAWEESGHDMIAQSRGWRRPTTEGEGKQKRRVQPHSLGSPPQDSGELDLHLRAVELAKEASENFMLGFAEYVTDRQLQHLFGIGLDSMVLVDPVAFTSPNWDNAVETLGDMYHSMYENNPQANRGVPYTTVGLLAATQGPYEWFPRSYAGEASEKLNGLQDAVIGGAEFEGEVICQGINLDLVLRAMEQLSVGGELVLVVGREFKKDGATEGELFQFLVDYPVVVTILQLDTGCLDNQKFTLSKNIAELSNGDYILMESRQTLAFPRDGALEVPSGLGIIQMNTYVNSSSNGETRFLVDGTMDKLLITADWTALDTNTSLKTSVRFYNQEESGFEPAVRIVDGTNYRAVWNIDAPTPGEWGFTFGEGSTLDYCLTVKGRSSIQLVDVSFVQAGGFEGHEGYFRVLQTPFIADTEIGIVGEVYGLFQTESTLVLWLLVDADTGDETELSMTPGLDPQVSPGYADRNTFFGVTKLPEGDFYVVVRGVDSLGYGFQRSSGQMFSAEYQSNQTYDIGDADSVVDFPDEWDEDESGPAMELAIMQRDVMRQTVSGTAPEGQLTVPFPGPLTPTGPFFPNATGFPDTGATTLGTAGVGTGASTPDTDVTTSGANVSATSPVLPTGPTSVIHLTSVIPFPPIVPTSVIPPFPSPGTSSFNTSALSATVPLPVTTNTIIGTGVTGTATLLPLLPPLSAPTSLDGASEDEGPTLSAVGTTSSPEPLSRLNATSAGSYSLPVPSASFGDVTAAIISETRTAEACFGPAETDTAEVPSSSTAGAPGETVATAGAVPQPEEPSSKIYTGCNVCGGMPSSIIQESPTVQNPSSSESSFKTIVIPHQSSTETQGPIANTAAPSSPAISALENPEDTTAKILSTTEVTSTTSRTTSFDAAPVPTSYEGIKGCPHLSPYGAPVPTSIISSEPGPACGPPDSFETASANGTHGGETAKGHPGHTSSSEAPERTSPSAETSGAHETASGEGMKGARAGTMAVAAVVFGAVVFLVL